MAEALWNRVKQRPEFKNFPEKRRAISVEEKVSEPYPTESAERAKEQKKKNT